MQEAMKDSLSAKVGIKRKNMVEFTLDPQLEAYSLPVARLDPCLVGLMSESHFAWLPMIPQDGHRAMLSDLSPDKHHRLMDKCVLVSRALKGATGCYSLNASNLGNQVRQLHINAIAASKTLLYGLARSVASCQPNLMNHLVRKPDRKDCRCLLTLIRPRTLFAQPFV